MSTDKGLIAGWLRDIARRADEGADMRDSLRGLAVKLDTEHRAETAHAEVANQGTEECPKCHGSRVLFAGAYVQCPNCKGWGRCLPAP